ELGQRFNVTKTYAKPRISLSVPQTAMDGDTVKLAVTAEGGRPVSFHWSFATLKGPDSIKLNIENPTSAATPAVVYWYPVTRYECENPLTSLYKVKLSVTFDYGVEVERTATLKVRVDRNWRGTVDHPAIKGSPEIRFDENDRRWYIAGPGTFERSAPS